MQQITDKNELIKLIKYVENEKKSVPYLYVNLKTYDSSNKSIKIYCDYNGDNISGIYVFYYDCLHFYTQNISIYPIDKVLQMICNLHPRVIMLQDDIGQQIQSVMEADFILERNHIIDMDNVRMDPSTNYKSVLADRNDIIAIADLLLSEEEYSIVYNRDTLIAQMLKRYDSGISRYYTVKEDNRVVASCSTYGETDDLALVGGVIVHKEWRRRGLAADVENHICSDLEKEGVSRVGFVNYENTASLALHTKLGAINHATYSKFIRK